MPEKIYAAVAGEIADSRKLSPEQLGSIPDIIRSSFKQLNRSRKSDGDLDYEIIRMDEFLAVSGHPVNVLHSSLMLASYFRFESKKVLDLRSDLKLSIGIGPVEMMQRALRESDGTAFRMADNGLRTMKRNQRLRIQTMDKGLDAEFAVVCGFMDILIHDWSDEQAEALFMRLAGMNQVEISNELDISQPAVNRRLKAAHYDAIEGFIERFEDLFNETKEQK